MHKQPQMALTAVGSAGQGSTPWIIETEERTKHETTFRGLNPSNGFITGKRAKEFFMSSKLPPMVLGHIWNLADIDRDGKMTMQEFSIAMHLIQCKMKGVQLPMTLPNSLKMSSMPSTFVVSQSSNSKSAGNYSNSFGQTSNAPVVNGFTSVSRSGPSSISWSGIGQSASTPAMSTGFGSNFTSMGPATSNSFTVSKSGFNSNAFSDLGQIGFGPSGTGIQHSQSQQNFYTITGQARLKYNEIFKSFDHRHTGFLLGEHVRSILLQSGLPQQILAQIWDLSDVDKDGKLNIEEFTIAMHLVDMVKSGKPLPQVLPQELVPPSMQVTFEDNRKENFEKERLEMERTARGEEERKQRTKLEAQQKKRAQFEKQWQQQLQKKREQEAIFGEKMKQQRLQVQLEAERERQLEWEKRKKEELLNQIELEQFIVNDLKVRVTKLSEDLHTVSGNRSEAKKYSDLERQNLMECQSALLLLNESRERRSAEISRVQCDIKERQQRLEVLARERERLSLERDKNENSSISPQSMEGDLAEKLKNLKNQLKELKDSVQQITNENARLQQIAESKREYKAWKIKKDREEREKREIEARRRREDEERKEEARKQREREMEAMRQEQEKQRKEQEMKKRLQEARKAEEKRQRELRQQQEQEKQRQQQLQRERELREKQLQEQQQQDYKKEQLLSKDKTIVQQQMSLQSKLVFKEEEPLKSAGGADVKSRIHQMQRLIADQQSDSKPKEPISVIQKPAIKCVKYQGLYEFDPRNPDELAIKEGDIIVVNPDHKNAPPGWLFGECNGKSGLFPENYAEKLSDQSAATKDAGKVESSPQSAITGGSNVAQLRQTLKLDLMGGKTINEPVASEQGPQAGAGTPVQGILKASALYAYRGTKENHLSFNKNDVITIREQQDMWWSGELNGKVGWFPKSYVKIVSTVYKAAEPTVKSETLETSVVQPVASEQKAAVLFECVAMYPYTGQAGDLSFSEGDIISVTKDQGEWWEGTCNGAAGIFPANYVKKRETEAPKAAPRAKQEIATVTAAYTATSPDELSLAPGQLILVKKKRPDGWWEGELQARGKKRTSGIFPGNHVKIMSKTDKKAGTPTTTPNDTPATSGRTTPQLTEEAIYDTPTTLVQSARGKLEQVLAMFPYSGQRPDELTFFKGSVINVMSKEGDWWKGELNGKVGVFPSNYVQPLTNIPVSTTQ